MRGVEKRIGDVWRIGATVEHCISKRWDHALGAAHGTRAPDEHSQPKGSQVHSTSTESKRARLSKAHSASGSSAILSL